MFSTCFTSTPSSKALVNYSKTRFEDTGQNDQDITNQSPIQKFQIHFVELDFRYLFTEHILIEFYSSEENLKEKKNF